MFCYFILIYLLYTPTACFNHDLLISANKHGDGIVLLQIFKDFGFTQLIVSINIKLR